MSRARRVLPWLALAAVVIAIVLNFLDRQEPPGIDFHTYKAAAEDRNDEIRQFREPADDLVGRGVDNAQASGALVGDVRERCGQRRRWRPLPCYRFQTC